MTTILRGITVDEQREAVELWHSVFGRDPGYFERYYSADPWYQQGDSLGAWVDGALASAVHLCRRTLQWEGASLLCGGIANVATLTSYRGQGLSRSLLQCAIQRMEEQNFDFSLLGTGIPPFYSRLGWESIDIPHFSLTSVEGSLAATATPVTATPTDKLKTLHGGNLRPLHLVRPDVYFDRWIGWNWMATRARLCELNNGYIILSNPDEMTEEVYVSEWSATDGLVETRLFQMALEAQTSTLVFGALPQHVSLDALNQFGRVERISSVGHMIRRVSMSEQAYERVWNSYVSGKAALWPADGY